MMLPRDQDHERWLCARVGVGDSPSSESIMKKRNARSECTKSTKGLSS